MGLSTRIRLCQGTLKGKCQAAKNSCPATINPQCWERVLLTGKEHSLFQWAQAEEKMHGVSLDCI